MREIAFRSLSVDDMQSLFLWLLRPHVAKWYAPAPSTFAEVVAKYGPRTQRESPVRAYVILIDGREAGYIQSYPIGLFPEYAAVLGGEAGVVGIDLFIGDENFLGWGLGSRAVRHFVDEMVFSRPDATACLAGPVEGNIASIRAFEKAGFRRWKTAQNERGERECVMRREREPGGYRIEPIDLERHLQTCIAFRRDMYIASFGSSDGLEEEMGPDNAHYIEQLRQRVSELPEGNAHLWLGERIVGQTEMRFDDEPGVGYVSLFYLAPECRGQGVGRLLHRHALDVFGARGMNRIRLSVSARNHPAIAFYRKLGWQEAGARPHKLPVELMEYGLRG
ncbi:MAG TPA: GNAT family N-acetyltransferase [Usitatibacter sp.]|nr:GNAT family N-acetyltransferase [Usitatibacter sp.]